MLIKNKPSWLISENEVTPERTYLNRRDLMKGGAAAALGLGFSSAASAFKRERTLEALQYQTTDFVTDEELTPEAAITNYNNFYEFGTSKDDPAKNAWRLNVKPWEVKVDGLTDAPGTYAFEDIIDMNALEERIYRLRCVEAWSMVVPWIGMPLAAMITKLKPQADAKYVRFETKVSRKEMPGTRWPVLKWPYVEGLRMDEAMNPLSLMAVGLYGKELPNQNGAPMRLVVPWKYGFKSIKSIVRIEFTSKQPLSSWTRSAPQEYGFYSNVNPNVDHPRWSQAKERRIGEFGRRNTLMFNGYEEYVAEMYAGMDLAKYY